MQLYSIRRRQAWKTPAELEATAARSAAIGNQQMADQVRWIRTYVVEETDGSLGTLCIYEGIDEAALRDHAQRVGMPADEIQPINTTVVVRDDPRQPA